MFSLIKCSFSKAVFKRFINHSPTFRRNILSSSYPCEKQWEERLKNELLSKVVPDAFFAEVSQRYVKKLKVAAVDIDIFSNCVNRPDQLDELEHLLRKLRKTKRTKDTLESTQHAVCKFYLKQKELNRLVRILNKRCEYGIFPDNFCFNLIMDNFIENKNFRQAARVAALMMLQEDFNNEISKRLALYAVYMYLNDTERVEWYDEGEKPVQEEEPGEDEEDIEYIRVPQIRNVVFDDHCDIVEPLHICGKTLYYVGKELDDAVGRSCQILGLAFYNKWDKALSVLEKFQKVGENVILEEIIEKVNDIEKGISEDDPNKPSAAKLVESLMHLKESGKVGTENLLEQIQLKLAEVKTLEEADKENLKQLYIRWTDERQAELDKQMGEILKEEKLKELELRKLDLKEKEKLYFFFENFNKHEMDLPPDVKRYRNERREKDSIR